MASLISLYFEGYCFFCNFLSELSGIELVRQNLLAYRQSLQEQIQRQSAANANTTTTTTTTPSPLNANDFENKNGILNTGE